MFCGGWEGRVEGTCGVRVTETTETLRARVCQRFVNE